MSRLLAAGCYTACEFVERVGISKRTLERRLKEDPTFPQPQRFARARIFLEADIAAAKARADQHARFRRIASAKRPKKRQQD